MADTSIGSTTSVNELNDMCPMAKKYALGTAINAALAQLGIAASDTTIALGDGTDAIVIGESDATGTPTITINGDTDACTVNIATVAGHTTNIGTGAGATNIGGAASGAVTIKSNGALVVGNAEANSLTLSGGAGLASLDGTTVAVGPATTSTIAVGSAAAGAITVSSNSTITVGNAEANSLTLSGGAGLASLDGTTVAVGPATTSTIAIGSATAGATTIKSNSTITIGNAECNGVIVDNTLAGFQIGGTATAALAIGGGTSATKLTTAGASKNFGGFWTESTDATGSDMRGLYWRHYLAGAGGAQSGEAARLYTTVSTSAANAARGAHISLDFGASGDIAGLGAAVDATLHVPDGNLGGTVAAVSADIHGDGANSECTGTASFFRASLQGTTTNLQDVYFLNVEGTGTEANHDSGEMWIETSDVAATNLLRCKFPDGDRYLMFADAPGA